MTVITKASPNGVDFVRGWEGTATKAYLCPAGVITIGTGFTMASKVFADYWMLTRKHKLRMGDTITLDENNMLLERLINEEYGAAVATKVKPTLPHHFDGATSTTINCGKGALNWKWAQALAAGNISDAARLLRTTATTANGRPLEGLKRRRKAEAALIETGVYNSNGPQIDSLAYISKTRAEIFEYQTQLMKLGYLAETGVDGVRATSDKAVRKFQKEKGLTVDGVVGPATRATLVRALDAQLAATGTAGGGAVAGGGSVAHEAVSPEGIDWMSALQIVGTVALVVVVVSAGFYVWRNRARLFGLERSPT